MICFASFLDGTSFELVAFDLALLEYDERKHSKNISLAIFLVPQGASSLQYGSIVLMFHPNFTLGNLI